MLVSCNEESQFYTGKYSDLYIGNEGVCFNKYKNENHYVQFTDSSGVQKMLTNLDSVILIDTAYYRNGKNYFVKHYKEYAADDYVLDYYLCTQICDSFILRFIIRRNTSKQYGVYAVDSIKPNLIVRRIVDYSSAFFANNVLSVLDHLNEIETRNFNSIKQYNKIRFYKDSAEIIDGIQDYAHSDESSTFSSVPSYRKLSVPKSMYFLQFGIEFYYAPFLEANWLKSVE